MDVIQDLNETNYLEINISEEFEFLIKKRNEFYGDLIDLNESTQKTKVNYVPFFKNSSTSDLEDESLIGNIVMDLPNED